MLQTLFYIPAEIAGIPVFGFGLVLAAWVVFSVMLLCWLVWRQGLSADTYGYLPVLALVATVIWFVLPAVVKPEGFPIRGYGMMMLLAVMSATGLAAWRAHRLGLSADLAFSVAFWLFVPGIIGARLFYVIEYWPEQYLPIYQQLGLRALLGALVNVANGGLVVYGSLFGAVAGLLAFVRKYRLPLLAVCDLIAPSIMLGMFLGRLGCLANGCCYGGACDRPWAVTFPPEAPPYLEQVARGQMAGMLFDGDPKSPPVLQSVDPLSPAGKAGLKQGDRLTKLNGYEVQTAGHVHGLLSKAFKERQPLVVQVDARAPVMLGVTPVPARSHPIHPTQIYSSINALVLCLLLLAYAPLRRRDGELFAMMLSVYPVARFLLEIIRTDESAVFGTGLSISQNVSLVLLLAASGLWCYILSRPPGRAFG